MDEEEVEDSSDIEDEINKKIDTILSFQNQIAALNKHLSVARLRLSVYNDITNIISSHIDKKLDDHNF